MPIIEPNQQNHSSRSQPNRRRQFEQPKKMGALRIVTILACTFCLIACLMPIQQVRCGRIQDWIQNLVGGGNSNSNNNNNNKEKENNANSNSNDSNDSDSAATGDSSNDQNLTPMMSAMNPFMRYPSFYDSFGPASYGGYPGMSFSNPMSAMSGLSPMAALSGSSLGSAFSPASFGPASFGSFGSSSGSPMSGSSMFGGSGGVSASSLNNVYAASPSLAMGGYTPYYGRRR